MKRYALTHTSNLMNALNTDEISLDDMQWVQLRSCQAWYIKGWFTDNSTGEIKEGYFLQSYNTLVAFIDIKERKVYDPVKYSPTTSRQVTWFTRDVIR